jgi:hypothetical protein
MGGDPDSETLCSILEQWEIYEIPKDSISRCVLDCLSSEATGCFLPLQWPDTIQHLREINPFIHPTARPPVRPYFHTSMAVQPCVGLWPLFIFLIFYTVGRTSWTGNKSVARPLPAHTGQHKHRINADRHPCLKWDMGEVNSCFRPRGHCDRRLRGLWYHTSNSTPLVSRL